jgi:hypothetical protein
MSHHCVGILGLSFNMIASFILLWFPPSVREYTEEGAPSVSFIGPPTAEGKRRHRIRKHGYSFAIALLILGFLLQLLDLLSG